MADIVQIPLLRDNYAYLLVTGDEALVVDPSEATSVLERTDALGVTLKAVVCTHHHADHTGGNRDLRAATRCEVIGSAADADRIPGLTRAVQAGERFVAAGAWLRVLDVHAHTRGHVAYVLDEPVTRVVRHGHGGTPTEIARLAHKPALFVGDTLFLAGCGRLFEGTPADLKQALETLAREADETLVCCGHEYTAANLRFAADVLPSSAAIAARREQLEDERGESKSSVPDLLAKERQTNPFLLCLEAEGRRALADRFCVEGADDPVAVLRAVREAKDAA